MSVVFISILGTLISLSAGTAKKISTTQIAINTADIAERFDQFIVQNQALTRDIDNDGFLELPEQWCLPNSALTPNPEDCDPVWPGFVPDTVEFSSIRNTLVKDAYQQDFRICSFDIGDQTSHPLRLPGNSNPSKFTDILNDPVFAIISLGPDGLLETDCPNAVAKDPIGDDQVRVLTYAEVHHGQIANRLQLVRNEIPECTATQALEVQLDELTGEYSWVCKDNYMPYATQDLPDCNIYERVVVNEDGEFECKELQDIGGFIAENISLSRIASPICRKGYKLADLISVSPEKELQLRCSRLGSYPVGIGAPTEDVILPAPTGNSCNAANAKPGNFLVRYRARDGSSPCLNMPEAFVAQAGCNGDDTIVFDVDSFLCFDSSLTARISSVCLEDEYAEFTTVEGVVQCKKYNERNNWIIPRAEINGCNVNDIIVGESITDTNNKYYCKTPDELLATVAPAASCGVNELVIWDAATDKFKCVAN